MKSKLILAFLFLAGGFGYAAYEYYDFTTTEIPQMEAQRSEVERKFASKQQEYNRLKEFAQNIETIKQELRELNLQLETAQEHMPRQFNLSGLLRKLTMLAQNSGVELSSFRPAKQEARGDGTFYSTINIDFEMRGTFTQCLVFFDQVSRLKRIVNIESLKMVVRDTSSSTRSNNGLVSETTGQIRTYRFTD